MNRRAGTILALASALAGLACIAVWIRSYHTANAVDFDASRGYWWIVAVDSGALYVMTVDHGRAGQTIEHWPAGSEGIWEEEVGQQIQRWKPVRWMKGLTGEWMALVQFWFLTAVLGVGPVWWVWRRKPSKGEGLCRQCGYDLRATPDRCPECGLDTP